MSIQEIENEISFVKRQLARRDLPQCKVIDLTILLIELQSSLIHKLKEFKYAA